MDANYWEAYYSRRIAEQMPSLFARHVADLIGGPSRKIIELGCGNGRDALFFASEGHDVLAVDQCANEIAFLQYQHKHLANIRFLCADFSQLPDAAADSKYDVIYSRFTLHSISVEQEVRVLRWAYGNLFSRGVLCIEVRGLKNEIFGLGRPVAGEENAFIYEGHYRRFLDFEKTCVDLKKIGFCVTNAVEKKGFAPFNGADETFIRIVAERL